MQLVVCIDSSVNTSFTVNPCFCPYSKRNKVLTRRFGTDTGCPGYRRVERRRHILLILKYYRRNTTKKVGG